MLYSIHHRTRYVYEDHVSYSHHLARLTPSDSPLQRRISSRILVNPAPDILSDHSDYFNNFTHFFSLTTPHQELVVDSYCKVLIEPPRDLSLNLSPAWESVRDRMLQPSDPGSLEAAEFVSPSPLCTVHPTIADYTLKSFRPGTPILEGVTDLTHRIHADFEFNPSATTVSTPVMEVFEKRAGVCQDFAHFQISCLRSIGLPASYVSGYLRTEPPPGQPRLIGADASHAWIAVFVPELGWAEFDATNDAIPETDHIRVARGRDYHDICPIRGTVYGGGAQKLEIGVTVTPE
ncbi:transglutaminase family protein [Haloferula rosea]|uniref:Transglutaminase family protein n=1 Tax=Haloferula rosea TaxID=490093 RepID=A0A934RD60_9BACT|nr:transglutaminase family protein [Haloferula rosea]MBK1827094.1 transglutaminase family protein [Haloferula rosea]